MNAPQPPRPRRWRRRLKWAFLTLAVLLVIGRLSLPWLLPWALSKAAAAHRLSAVYERLELSILGGDAELWHLVLAPLEGGQPYLHAEYCRADLAVLHLFLGQLVVRRLDADGIDLTVERGRDGRIELLERLGTANGPADLGTAAPDRPPHAPETAAASVEIDLTPPIEIDAMRLDYLHATWRDLSTDPPLETRFDLNVRLSDLAAAGRPARFELNSSSPPFLDAFSVEGEGSASGKDLQARLQVRLTGLHCRPLEPYLRPLGLRPIAGALGFQASVELSARAALDGKGIQGRAVLGGAALTADGAEAAALDRIVIEADSIDRGAVRLKEFRLEGIRLAAERSASGRLRAAGFEIAGAPRPDPGGGLDAGAGEQPEPAGPEAPARNAIPAPCLFELGTLAIRDLAVECADRAVEPQALLAVLVPDVTVRNIILDPARPQAAAAFSASLLAPGIFGSLEVRGLARPFAPRREVEMDIEVRGIEPRAIEPHLAAAGLQPALRDGALITSLQASVEMAADGRILAEANLGYTRFSQDEPYLILDGARLCGIEVDPEHRIASVEEAELAGPSIIARRTAGGDIEFLGMRLAGGAAAPAAPRQETEAAGEALPLPASMVAAGAEATAVPAMQAAVRPPEWPERAAAAQGAVHGGWDLRAGRIAWTGLRARWIDGRLAPARSIVLEDAGAEATGIRIDLGSAAPAVRPPASVRAWMKAPGLADEILVRGTLQPDPRAASLRLDISGSGVTLQTLAPYLAPGGLEPVLRAGAFRCGLRADLALSEGGANISAALEGFSFRDGDEELLGLDGVRLQGMDVSAAGVRAAELIIDRPRIAARRDEAGVFRVAGIGFEPRKLQGGPPAPASGPAPAAAQAPASDRSAAAAAGEPGLAAVLDRFRILGAEARWSDGALQAPVETALQVSLELDGLAWGFAAPPAALRARIEAPGVIDALTIDGKLELSPLRQGIDLALGGRGLRAGPLAAYLPPGIEAGGPGERLELRAAALVERLDGGALAARFEVGDLSFRSETAEGAHLQWKSFRAIASKIDLPDRVEINEIALEGLRLDLSRAEDGALEALGVRLAARPPGGPASDPAAQPAAPPPPQTPAPASSGEQPPAPVTARKEPQRRGQYPLVILRRLDIGLEKVSFTDRRTGKPVALEGARLASVEPIELLGEDAESRPPAQLELAGRVPPLIGSFHIGIAASPFALEPELKVDLEADGLRGKYLAAVFPDLEELIDGAPLEDGSLEAHLEAILKPNRRDPIDFSLAGGAGLDLSIKNIRFTGEPGGPVLVGLDELRLDIARLRPDTGAIHARELEIHKPIARAALMKDGLHAFGIIFKPLRPGEPGSAAPGSPPAPIAPADTGTSAAPEAAPVAGAAAQAPSAAPGEPAAPADAPARAAAAAPPAAIQPPPPAALPDMRLDRFFLSGIDLVFDDETISPPFHLDLNGMEAEARNVGSRLLTEPQFMRFAAAVQARKTEMPAALKGGMLGGALGDSLRLLGGKGVDTERKFENRELFDDVSLRGRLALFPKPSGFLKLRVAGLDLGGLQGPAGRQGVSLEGGILDNTVVIRMPGNGDLDLETNTRLTDLQVSEAPDGPIYRHLHLPAPLDAVLFALRDQAGAVAVPLRVHVGDGKVSAGQVAAILTSTLSKLIATTIAKTPMRAVSAVTGLLPFGAEEEEAKPEKPVFLEFEPASSRLPVLEAAKLGPILHRIQEGEKLFLVLEHEIGGADLPRAALRANPSRTDCLELGARLRRDRGGILAERDREAETARLALASGLWNESRAALAAVRRLEGEIADLEVSIDRAYDLTGPGAERQAERRTRDAVLEIARARMESIRAAIIAGGGRDAARSMRINRPAYREPPASTPGRVTIAIQPRRS